MTKASYKIGTILDKTLDVFIKLICALLMLMAVYALLDNLWLYQGAQDRSLLVYKPELGVPLTDDKVVSENQVAWIYLYDTDIDYPVMQGKDNTEYLNKDPYGDFKLSGSIFLDYRNNKDLTDEYSVIYGHHMEHGNMFGALDDFRDQAYFDAHKNGRIITANAVYDYELFAVASGDATDKTLFDPRGRTTSEIIEYLNQNSILYTGYENGCRIVALSTCSGDTNTARLLIFGMIRES